MRLIIQSNEDLVGRWTANYMHQNKQANPTADKPFKLGLPTGSSPLEHTERIDKSLQKERYLSKM